MREPNTPETNEARAQVGARAGFDNGNREHMECNMDDTTNHSPAQAGAETEGDQATHTQAPETPEQRRQREALDLSWLTPETVIAALERGDWDFVKRADQVSQDFDTIYGGTWDEEQGQTLSERMFSEATGVVHHVLIWGPNEPWKRLGITPREWAEAIQEAEFAYNHGRISIDANEAYEFWSTVGWPLPWVEEGITRDEWDAPNLKVDKLRQRGKAIKDRDNPTGAQSGPSGNVRRTSSPVPPMIAGVLPARGGRVGIVYGDHECGKTSVALHAVGMIALGKPFAGLDTDGPRASVYVAYEDGDGLQDRMDAWMDYHAPGMPREVIPLDAETDPPRFVVRRSGADLDEGNADVGGRLKSRLALALREAEGEFGCHGSLARAVVVLDTVSMMLAGDLDPDSPRDVSVVLRTLREVGEELGVNFLVLHHTGHRDKNRPRGAINWLQDSDFAWHLTVAQDGTVEMRVPRMKSMRKSDRVFRFALRSHTPPDGRTAPVLDELPEVANGEQSGKGATKPDASASKPAAAVSEADGDRLAEAPASTRGRRKAKGGGASKADPKREAVRTALAYAGEAGTTAREIEKATGGQITHSTADRHIKALVKDGEAVRGEDGKYRLAHTDGVSEAA